MEKWHLFVNDRYLGTFHGPLADVLARFPRVRVYQHGNAIDIYR